MKGISPKMYLLSAAAGSSGHLSVLLIFTIGGCAQGNEETQRTDSASESETGADMSSDTEAVTATDADIDADDDTAADSEKDTDADTDADGDSKGADATTDTATEKSGDMDTGTDADDTSTIADTMANTGTDETSHSDAYTDEDSDTDKDSYIGDIMTPYEGFEELYILTNEDDPTDVCRVRYDLHAVGEPEVPCSICEWDVVVERSNPSVVVDLEGACANSDLSLDDAAIAGAVGKRDAYGFAREYVGHASILMRYNENTGQWDALTTSNWDPTTSALRYNRRDGLCSYGNAGEAGPPSTGICGMSGEATVSN